MREAVHALHAPLRRIRRRLRLWRALDGAIAGAAVGLLAAALTTLALHHFGASAGRLLPLACGGAGAALGGLVRAAPRIPLERCARAADAALDRQDRVLSALDLTARTPAGPLPAASPALVEALVADAVARLGGLVPARAVPARRPRGFPALAAGAVAAVVAGLSPMRSRAASPLPSRPAAPAGARLAPGALEAERDTARAAAQAAARLEDARLAQLAGELEQTLTRLASGGLDEGGALDALRSIAARADDAARAAERDRGALDAASNALARQPATRAAAEALRAGGDGAGDRAGAAMGRGADAHPAEAARALAAAAQALAGAGAQSASNERGRRRLAREGHDAPSPNGSNERRDPEGERRLERLSRDLNDTAAACRDGDETCRRESENRARELAQLGQRASAADALRRLERAAQQARARLGRGDLRESGDSTADRRFQRDARGESASDSELEGQGEDDGTPQRGAGSGSSGESSDGQAGEGRKSGESGKRGARISMSDGDGEGAKGEATLAARGAESSGASAEGGDGIGHDPGGPPLGRAEAPGGRGRDAEARVTDGAGPNRAQVIGVAAGRGFAGPGYARVFADYQAAVEEAMSATAVPEGKRYLVRRYFDLIRPRATGGRK